MSHSSQRQLTCASGHRVARLREPGRGSRIGGTATELIVRLACARCNRDFVRAIDLERIGTFGPPPDLIRCPFCDGVQGFANLSLRLLCLHCPQCDETAIERLPAPIIDLEANGRASDVGGRESEPELLLLGRD